MKIEVEQTAVIDRADVEKALDPYLRQQGFIPTKPPVFVKCPREDTGCGDNVRIEVVGYKSREDQPLQLALWSVGATPEDAIRARWPDADNFTDLDGGDDTFSWGRCFTACDGTAFKAAGVDLPGGTAMTWWK